MEKQFTESEPMISTDYQKLLENVQEPIPKREIIWDMEDDGVPQDNEWDETYDEDEWD